MTVNPNNNPLAYLGVVAQTPPNEIVANRSPTNADVHFPVGTQWTNEVAGSQWVLTRFVAGVPDWAETASSSGSVQTLTGDSGGAISPTLGNINLLGGTGMSISGSGSTLTFNVVGEGEKTVSAAVVQPMANNTSYVVPQQASTTLTLPATSALGDVVTVYSISTNPVIIAQNATQQVFIVNKASTSGDTGTTTFNEQYDSITLKVAAVGSGVGTKWVATAVSGTMTLA